MEGVRLHGGKAESNRMNAWYRRLSSERGWTDIPLAFPSHVFRFHTTIKDR